jgi:hypothetical protein
VRRRHDGDAFDAAGLDEWGDEATPVSGPKAAERARTGVEGLPSHD